MKSRLPSTISTSPHAKKKETRDIGGSLTGVDKESSFLNIKSFGKYLTVYMSTGRNISEDLNRQREVLIAFKLSRTIKLFYSFSSYLHHNKAEACMSTKCII
jgi:hypothetical protein